MLILLSFACLVVFSPMAFALEPTTTPTYAGQWGATGSGDGQFSFTQGLAVDSFDNIYVADAGNNRIQKFDSSGTYLSQFGSYGTGNGQFDGPTDMVVGTDGNIYVADASNNRIQKFDSSGAYIAQWGSSGSEDGQFNSLKGIVVDSSNDIYVIDYFNSRIQKFDSSGTYLSQFGSPGEGDGQFYGAQDLAIDASGDVYVVADARIQKFDSDGTYLSQFGEAGTGDGQFIGPTAITMDSFGNIYVLDPSEQRIQKFDSSGTYLAQWGSSGYGDGEFSDTTGLVTDSSDGIYVSGYNFEGSQSRVQKFTYPQQKSLINSSGKAISLAAPAGTAVTCNASVAESSLDVQDTDLSYPLGLVDFCLTVPEDGSTTTVTLTFETDLSLSDVVARKYSPETETYQDVPGATITETTLNSNPALQLTYDITDGGDLDDDGIANGEILDPVGLAVANSSDSADGSDNTNLADTGDGTQLLLILAAGLLTIGVALGARNGSEFLPRRD